MTEMESFRQKRESSTPSMHRTRIMAVTSAIAATNSWLFWRAAHQQSPPQQESDQQQQRTYPHCDEDDAGETSHAERCDNSNHNSNNNSISRHCLPSSQPLTPLDAHIITGTPFATRRRCARPPRLDTLMLDHVPLASLTTASKVTSHSHAHRGDIMAAAMDEAVLSFCSRCAAATTNLVALPSSSSSTATPTTVVVSMSVLPCSDDTSPDRRRAEWQRLRHVLPVATDTLSEQRCRDVFAQCHRTRRGGVDGAEAAACDDQDDNASLRWGDLYHGLVMVLHLNRLSRCLRVLVERAYAEAHTLCVCAQRAGRWENAGMPPPLADGDQVVLTEIVSAHDQAPLCAATLNDRHVSYAEFRLILSYLADYFTFVTHVQAVVSASAMSKVQWPAVTSVLGALGVRVSDATALFCHLDPARQGVVTVDAACAWAAGQKMWLDGHSCAVTA